MRVYQKHAGDDAKLLIKFHWPYIKGKSTKCSYNTNYSTTKLQTQLITTAVWRKENQSPKQLFYFVSKTAILFCICLMCSFCKIILSFQEKHACSSWHACTKVAIANLHKLLDMALYLPDPQRVGCRQTSMTDGTQPYQYYKFNKD